MRACHWRRTDAAGGARSGLETSVRAPPPPKKVRRGRERQFDGGATRQCSAWQAPKLPKATRCRFW